MGKIKAGIVIFLLLVLVGCSREGRIGLGYGKGAFECELGFERCGERVRATLISSAPYEGGERDISLLFHEPSAMRGICVRREGGRIWAEFDGMIIESEGLSGWLESESLFETEGELSYISSVSEKGEEADILGLLLADGEKLEITLSRSTELPLRIVGYGIDAEIIYFEDGA